MADNGMANAAGTEIKGTIVLAKCRIGRKRIVEHGDVVFGRHEKLTIDEALARFSPNKNIIFMVNLLSAPRGAYVGTVRSERGVPAEGFVLILPESGDLAWLDQRDSGWRDRIIDIYRIVGKDFEYALQEGEVSGTHAQALGSLAQPTGEPS